jgi:hypothetical protein
MDASPGEISFPLTFTSAGDITVSGGTPIFSATISPAANDQYLPQTAPFSNPGSFHGGEDVRFQAKGGKLPSVDETRQFPLVLLLQQPIADPSGTITVSPTRDLQLVWTRGEPNLELWVEGSSPTMGVLCRFDSTVGQGTVPADVLSGFAPQDSALWLTTVSLQMIQQGAFRTSLEIATSVHTPDKRQAIEVKLE